MTRFMRTMKNFLLRLIFMDGFFYQKSGRRIGEIKGLFIKKIIMFN